MSDVVEKTLASLPKILSEGLLGGPPSPRKTSARGFQVFIRLVNRARTKQEEEHVIKQELTSIQQQLSQADVKQTQVCDNLCRILYCGILGYDVTFGYIHAIKLAQNSTTIVKRIGYLTSTLLLHEDHELILLLINTIQKDLQSSNILHNLMALNAVCQLVNSEMVPMVLPLVQEKLQHPRELVRVKAVTCMHRFVLKTPSLVQHCQSLFKASLCDKDPGVMSVAVSIYYHLVKRNPENFHSIVPVLVNILQQVVNGILPASFEYHSIPLPWLQIQILRTLALLGVNNTELSKQMYSVLADVLQKTNMKDYMAFGVMYECITTITNIYPEESLLQEAAKCVSRFIRSTDNNLRYIGIKSLTSLVRVRPESALDYQMIVVELLDDPHYAIQRKEEATQEVKVKNDIVKVKTIYVKDETVPKCKVSLWRELSEADVRPGDHISITDVVLNVFRGESSLSTTSLTKLQTLELLFNMANPVNVQVVIGRLLDHMTKTSNKYWQMDIAGKVVILAEKFSSSGQLYVDTMIKLLQLNKTSVPPDIVNKIIGAVQKGCGVCETSQNKGDNPVEFKQHLIKKCVECLFIKDSSPELVQISAWVLGEFADMLKNMPEDKIISLFLNQFTRPTLDVSTKLWIISSLLKLSYSKVLSSDIINEKITDLNTNEENLLIKQKLKELLRFSGIKTQFQGKNGTKTSQVDFTLSFLDDFVINSLEHGCPPYKPCYLRKDTTSEIHDKKSLFSGLNPVVDKTLSEDSSVPSQENATGGESISSSGISDSALNVQETGLNLTGVKRRWGKEGFIGEEKEDTAVQDEAKQTQIQQGKLQEIEKKKELASALFGGISPQQTKFRNEGTVKNSVDETRYKTSVENFTTNFEEDIQMKCKSDAGNWRKVHTEQIDLGANKDTELSPLDHSGSQVPEPLEAGAQDLNFMSNTKMQTSHHVGQFSESEVQNLNFANNHEIPFSQDEQSATGSQNSNQQINFSRDREWDVGTENLSFASNTDMHNSSTTENIDFMKYSELKPSSSERDYFNPVTGNWELDLNTDINKPLSQNSLIASGSSQPNFSSDNLLTGQDNSSNIFFNNPPDE